MAACLTDTKDLAVNPATTVKDSHHTGIDQLLYKQSFSGVLSPHLSSFRLYLTYLSVALPSPLSYTFLIWASSVNKDAISIWLLLPETLSLLLSAYLALCAAPLSIIHAVHVSYPVSHFLPSLRLNLSLSLSLSPANGFIVLGSGRTMSAHMGPCAVPAAKAGSSREHP